MTKDQIKFFPAKYFVCAFVSEVCVTEDGQRKCTLLRERYFKAFERLLCKRFNGEDALKVMGDIRWTIAQLNSYSAIFELEWDRKYLENTHITWPKFIMDLIVSPIPQKQHHSQDWNCKGSLQYFERHCSQLHGCTLLTVDAKSQPSPAKGAGALCDSCKIRWNLPIKRPFHPSACFFSCVRSKPLFWVILHRVVRFSNFCFVRVFFLIGLRLQTSSVHI